MNCGLDIGFGPQLTLPFVSHHLRFLAANGGAEIVSFDDRRSLSLSTAVEAEISYASVGGGGRGDGREEATTASALHLLPFTGAAQQHYVSQLLSFTLDRLHKEPELLRVDAERIRRQMQEVAVGNYRAFIAAADTVSFIKEQLSGFDKHLDSLITGIPNLTAGCTEFIESAQKILEESKLNQILLDNHSTLLDLLEIPQLMDTCIRNGNYDEALDLEAFVNKLSKMHTELPIIQALASEVRKTPQSLLSQLLQKLRSNIQVKHCISNFNILCLRSFRDSYCFSASVLDFLLIGTHRHSKPWFMLLHSNLYILLLGFLCLMLYDVFLFHVLYNFSLPDSSISCTYGNLISILQSSIRYLLSPCRIICFSYCAMGLGLVGFDFRGLLPSLFESAVINLFSKNMSIAVENFQIVLDLHRWVPLPSVGFVTN
ncbi:unnamed protein product [Musa acuminata subsp. malaccensis]|uniref:Conserved oligomeric Golgi complex subunit 8 n=1 Tax=Musa acuminata subsp. malaccensis TaxID=214687 RepID=A0A804IJ83_MUSAM|nr:unnamed protein product [Musa acuminata subsp. malaccensis]